MRLKARLDNQSTFEVIRESGSRGKTRFLFHFKSIETKSFIQRLFTSAEGVCFLNYSSFNEQFVRKQMSSLRGRHAAGLLPLSKHDGSESPWNGTKTAAFYLWWFKHLVEVDRCIQSMSVSSGPQSSTSQSVPLCALCSKGRGRAWFITRQKRAWILLRLFCFHEFW